MSFNPARAQRIGNLRHKITWQEQVTVSDPQWGHTVSWVDRGTEPARVEPVKGREFYASNETLAESTFRVFARYRRVPNTGDWRIVWWTGHTVDGASERLIFDIINVSNPDERGRFVECLCENTNSLADA